MLLFKFASIFQIQAQTVRIKPQKLPQRDFTPSEDIDTKAPSTLHSKDISDQMIHSTSRKFNRDPRLLRFLGAGVFNKTFLYKNHVLKFTLSHDDVNAVLRLEALRSKLQDSKHLLKVYDVEYDQDNGLYMIEVEYLEPLDPHLKMMLFQGAGKQSHVFQTPRKTFNVLRNKEAINQLLHLSWSDLSKEQKERLQPHKTRLYHLVEQFIVGVGERPLKINELVTFIGTMLRRTVHFVMMNIPDLDYNDVRAFVNGMHDRLALLLQTTFPKRSEIADLAPAQTQYYETIPESRSVMQFLGNLRDAGVYWNDLHGNNLMQRPSTREIVISDPGLFRFYD
jgi:hypothetical protein